MPSTIARGPLGLHTSEDAPKSPPELEFARLATVVEQASDAMLITDTTGNIQYVNPAFERITGYDREQVIGRNPRLLKSSKVEPAVYENLWDTISHGQVWKGHLTNRRRDGSFYEVDATVSPVFDDSGKIVNYAAVTRDITQEIELEIRLRQTEKMEAVGQLASGVAHDFNNLLTAILGHVGLLKNKLDRQQPSWDQLARSLDQIEYTAQQGASLTRQLLAFNRREEIRLEPLNPSEVLENAERLLRRLIASNIVFGLELAPETHTILGDRGQLEQVLMNLVVNARDAMPTGGQLTIATKNVVLDELYVAIHADSCIGPHVMLSVRDSGCGMNPDVLQRIYEPFFTTKPPNKGTGLGLATVYAIVRRFNGHITVVSAPGEGTEFRVYLPATTECATTITPDTVEDSHDQGTETILVCEDDATIRDLECELLKRNGYTVLRAEHGLEALELARGSMNQIDLLITDIVMPEMNGPALARELATLRPDLRILFVSGYTDETIEELGARRDYDHLLPKPFTSRGFLRRVRETLDHNGT